MNYPGTLMQLYDSITSPNCQRVKIVLEEKQLPYRIIPVDLKANEQKKPDFLRLNPYGKVPVLIDGQAVLYESCIINEYLEEKYPDRPLMPDDFAKRARIRILIDYGLNHFAPPFRKIREELRSKPEEKMDRRTVEDAVMAIIGLFERLEREIGDKSYLAGDFSLLDAALIPRYLRMEKWSVGIFPNPSLPRLGAWLQRMKERPSVQTFLDSISV